MEEQQDENYSRELYVLVDVPEDLIFTQKSAMSFLLIDIYLVLRKLPITRSEQTSEADFPC